MSTFRITVYALIQIYKQKIIRLYKYATQSPSIHELRVIGYRLQQVAGCRPRVALLRYSTIFHCIVLYCIVLRIVIHTVFCKNEEGKERI